MAAESDGPTKGKEKVENIAFIYFLFNTLFTVD